MAFGLIRWPQMAFFCEALFSGGTLCFAQNISPPASPPPLRPYSSQSNYMSLVGYARWRHFQETREWTPQIIREVIAESPVDGGFNWPGFLQKLQPLTKRYPYARLFVLSWHIDTIGPTWTDNYYLLQVYDRDRGLIYNPLTYKGRGFEFKLDDALIPRLNIKFKELIQHGSNFYNAEEELTRWWKKQTR